MTAPGLSHGGGATNKAAIEVMDKRAVISREVDRIEATMHQLREGDWKAMASRDFDNTMRRWRQNSDRLLQTIQDVAELLQKYNKRLVGAQQQAGQQVAALGSEVDSTNYSAKMTA